jgi:hypothetical protein
MTQAHVRKQIAIGHLGAINDVLTGKNSPKISTNEGSNNYLQKDIQIQMTGPVVNKGQDFTITFTDQNMDFTEFQKSYITLHLTMNLTFDNAFQLSSFTTRVGPPQTWNFHWSDFGLHARGKAHNVLYRYEILVLPELPKQQFIYFGFKHATDCIQQLTVKVNGMDIETTMKDKYPIQYYLVNVVKSHMEKDQKRDTVSL